MSENLLSRLEQSLRQSRAARMHLAARLRELEAEADSVRAELAEMDTLASQTEAAIYRLLVSPGAGQYLAWSAVRCRIRGRHATVATRGATASRFQRSATTLKYSAIDLWTAPSRRQ